MGLFPLLANAMGFERQGESLNILDYKKSGSNEINDH
jgi:hypothetical protein